MNHAVVVDASVVVKWVVTTEVLADRALALLDQTLQARRRILAPPHLASEVSNALYQRVRTTNPRQQLTEVEATQALVQFLAYPIELIGLSDLYERAFHFARLHRLPSMYDSLYVVLAQMVESEVWTADQRLLQAIGSAAPWVRWIGDYPGVS